MTEKTEWETFDTVSLKNVQDQSDEPKNDSMPTSPVQKPVISAILDPTSLERTPTIEPPSILTKPNSVNGRILATVFPENLTCDWVTPPNYDTNSIPSILTIDVPTVPSADYVAAIKAITEDKWFRIYCILYSRVIAVWMTLSILLLVVVLLSQSRGGWPVMIFCFIWTFVLFAGIYLCAVIRRFIRIKLRHCVEEANKILVSSHILVGVEDRGQLSCHKVVLHFMRYNVLDCTSEVARQLRIQKTGGCVFGDQVEDVTIESAEKEANRLILKFAHGFVKSTVKHRLIIPSKPTYGVSEHIPKHCKKQLCLCQFIEERHFHVKAKKWYARYV